MVLLRHLSLENFLSHQRSSIDFRANEKLLIDGVSGSGKTAIVEAIVWALYGQGRVDNRSLVMRGKKKAVVTLTLADGEKLYRIERSVTDKGKHTVEVQEASETGVFAPIGRMGIKDIQNWIETELIGASYLLFTNSIAYIQDNVDTFVKQSAARRKELLLEIVNAGGFDELYKKASEEIKDREIDLVSAETELRTIEAIDEASKSDAEMLPEFRSREADLVTKQKETEVKIEDLEIIKEAVSELVSLLSMMSEKERSRNEAISTLLDKKNSIKDDIANLEQLIKDNDIDAMEKLVAEYENVQIQVNKTQKIVEAETQRKWKLNSLMANKPSEPDHNKKIKELEKQIAEQTKDATACPAGDKCPFAAPHVAHVDWLKIELEKEKEALAKLSTKMKTYDKQVEDLSSPLITEEEMKFYNVMLAKLEKISATERKLVEIKKLGDPKHLLVTAQKQLSEIDSSIDKEKEMLSNVQKDIAVVRTKLDTIGMSSVGEVSNKIASEKTILSSIVSDLLVVRNKISVSEKAKSDIEKNSAKKKELLASIKKVKSELESLEAIKAAFGQRGIPAVVVDYIAPRLEERINTILSQLSEFRIRIDTQRQNSTGDGVVEGLFLTITNDTGEELDFDSYSGGQKLKITVSIAEALASLQRVGFRIFDEVFFALDEQSTEDFADVMDKLQEKFNQVLCITHLRNVKDLFDERLLVTRTNGVSHVAA